MRPYRNRRSLSGFTKIVFKHLFTYNIVMVSDPKSTHPAINWENDIRRYHQSPQLQLRLAAMVGHMRLDKIAARRAALIDVPADGRPHTREVIWETVAAQLSENCWGKRPHEALARDLAALRKGGIRIAYSRRPGITGYYLQYPALKRPSRPQFKTTNWELIEQIRRLSVPEKNERAFAAAQFALNQKRLILAEEHPN